MVGEQNGHYPGRVKRVYNGIVEFRLDTKLKYKDKRTIKLDENSFYLIIGDKEKKEKIKEGESYNLRRKPLKYYLSKKLERRKARKVERIEVNDDGMPDLSGFPTDDNITGTGIENILNQDDTLEIDDEDNEIKVIGEDK